MNTVYQASAEVPPSSAAAGSASCSLCGFVVRQRKAKETRVQLEVTGLSNESGSTSPQSHQRCYISYFDNNIHIFFRSGVLVSVAQCLVTRER